jgi:hypothetical protein
MRLLTLQLGVLGSIVLVLFVIPLPLYAGLVRRFRDAGIWSPLPIAIPAYVILAPPFALAIDSSVLDLPAMNRGLPELFYAGLGYLALCAGMLGVATMPSRSNTVTTVPSPVTL